MRLVPRAGSQRDGGLARAGRVAAVLTRVTLQSGQRLGPDVLASPGDNSAVHQAAGMVSVQVGCSTDQARHLLSARAFADGVSVARVAGEVVRGAILFEPTVLTPAGCRDNRARGGSRKRRRAGVAVTPRKSSSRGPAFPDRAAAPGCARRMRTRTMSAPSCTRSQQN
jgi:hypothetical protein